ncbi:MAG: ParB N-terminal domain-containing protein [Candidatus Bipolaricaulis sp.]|jgi:hypothetical protein|nr:ParB N-terminal domain-containing protein [Candidatus Bipolaricaulis sp.]
MMKITYKNPSEIKPYPNNPRLNEDAIDKVARSISEFGFRQPIVIDKDNTIIVGHTRWKAALRLNLDKVPVHVATDLTLEQIKAYRIADNKTSEFSDWDWPALKLELNYLKELDIDLDWLGLDDFSPNINPFIESQNVTGEDILKAREKLDSQYDKGKDMIEVVCPECGKTFYIEK